jgi:drug/metabolite transporter (DMT)-like permease
MPAAALALVLAAAVFHAGWNLTLHRVDDRVATMAVAGLVTGLALLPVALLFPPWAAAPQIALSALAETAYALCLSAAYQRGALALAYPIGRGTAPLLITLGGWLLLHERPGPMAVAGALALAAGLALVATAGRAAGQSSAIGFALLTGVTIASYSLIDAQAVRQVPPVGYLGIVMGLQGLLLTAWLRGDLARLHRALRPGLLVAVGTTISYLLVLLAFQQAAAGRVATLRELSVLLGLALTGGRHGWRIWLGAALVVAGAILTAL